MGVKYAFLLVALIAGTLAVPAPKDDMSIFFDHTVRDPSGRIIGGTQVPAGGAPHMVALSTGLLIRSFLCGGSLITERHVMTAAHCIAAVYSAVWGSLSSSLSVTVGTVRWNLGGANYNVARNITHPNYLSGIIKNDIGFLVTTRNVVLTNFVSLAPLSFDWAGPGVVARVTGWGRTRTGGSISSNLMELTVSVVDGNFCITEVARVAAQLNRWVPDVEPHIEICTFHSLNHGTCNGDSGSALMRMDTNQQIGVVSWGLPCANGAPDMFVRISAYRDWILNVIQ